MGVIDIDVAEAIIDEMAKSLEDVIRQALQKQAREIAERYQRDKEGRNQEYEVHMQHMAMAHEREQALHIEMGELQAENNKLMAMVAPLEVWVRIILPEASSVANKKAVNRDAAWRADGKYSICATGAATIEAMMMMKKRKKRDNNAISLPSFKYDRVFDPTCMNSDVYSALSVHVKHGIESKHLMLIMYGRSGTGKSETLIKPYRQELEKHVHPPLIQSILRTAFVCARARFDGQVSARVTCLEYRSGHFYDLGVEKPQRWAKADAMDMMPGEGVFKISGKAGVHKAMIHTSTSADDAVSHIQASDKRRGEGKTEENSKSSRGHAWYEVRMCLSSRGKGDDGQLQELEGEQEDDLGVYTFFDLGGLEQLQTGSNKKGDQKHGAKTESNSLTMALGALKTPFRAIAARETEWEAPDGNAFVQAITHQLKGTGAYDKFGRPQMIILGQVNGYEERREESREVLETLQSWRTLG